MEFKTIARKWGSSIGVILPKSIIDENRIRENDEVFIELKKETILSDLFGKFPRKSKKNPQEIKDEAREGW
ncbi:MAG: AbrB/MazE/SpoVT family DNA-binding domain-containing protein [Candidatus Pacearchaeota archaeon]|jgi:antitoxin component of MazEF toxin-antitoxin module